MARGSKSADRASAKQKKEEKKKQNKAAKTPDFQTDVRVITQGKISKSAKISRESVKKHSSARKGEKPKKAAPAKFFKNRVEFKDKIAEGNKNKKVLEFNQVKMIEQLDSDSRMAFVIYETPENNYFIVLGMKNADEVSRFMKLASESNPTTEIRLPESTSNADSEEGGGNRSIDDPPVETYNEDDPQVYRPQSTEFPDSVYERSDSPPGEPWDTKSTFICADPHIDDGTVYSSGTPDTFATQFNNLTPRSYKRGSYSTFDEMDDNRNSARLITQSYCVGPDGDEDSIFNDKYRQKTKKSYSRSRRQYYSNDDASDSTTSSSNIEGIEYFQPEAYKKPKTPNARRPPSSKTSMSRRSSRRLKSRELPLSEAEKNGGGWHSDVMFVTPTKDGGVKVSADGPVMLYTATRANGSRDFNSEDETTSDGESTFSYSSESSATFEPNGMPSAYGVNYSRGRR